MKYVLVNKFDEIVDTVQLKNNVGPTWATTYFQGVKRLPNSDDFEKLWRVMSDDEYNTTFKNTLYDRQMGKRKYEWWKDEDDLLDGEKS